MIASRRDESKVRGIVAGSVLRRVVCRAVATQIGEAFLQTMAPYQYALRTRAGTDALAHAIRSLIDHDPDAVVVSLDWVGAFDRVH
eukprot:2251569-Karenia_brevis.AAC.1